MTSCPDPDPVSRVLLAAGTASYDCAAFSALDKVPASLGAVVAALTSLGFATVHDAPGYRVDPVLAELRAAARHAAAAAPVVVVYYTGHGAHPELDTYYLVSRASRPDDFSGTALAAAELPRLLTRRDEAGEVGGDQPQVLVILDCCYSGQAGMEMLGEALRGRGNPRLWAIASAGALEYARQGEFAAAFCDALERPTTGPSTQFLSLESVVQAVNDARGGRGGQEARVFVPATGSAGIPPFFPNRHYRPGLAGLTVSEQHWLSRVRGAPGELTAGFYLTGRTGRTRAAEDLISWMTSSGGGLAVVTGSPGTGKSTLLALPVLLTQPARRMDLLASAKPGSLTQRAAAGLPADTLVAAVHARGLNSDQAARLIAEALGLVPGSAATLLEDLKNSPRQPAVVVVDALDEADSPPDMVADLLLPLCHRAGLRVAVGGRRHAVPGTAQLTIDLDRPDYQDPEALVEYLRRLLAATEEPGVHTPYQGVSDEVTGVVAAAIARRATSRDGRIESFLIGRILALSIRGRPEPADVNDPNWQAKLPSELTDAFDEDIARLGDRAPLARTLLEALAWAQGPGLPWENVWVPVAQALASPGRSRITNDDVRWLLDKAGAYIVEDLGPGQRSVYRPFHDLLAAYLRGEPTDATPDSPEDRASAEDTWRRHRFDIEDLITDALLGTVPVDATGQRQWDLAHPYLQTYLMQHADTGTEAASELVLDKGFLAVTDQATFSPYLGLRAFEEMDAPLFFGREREIEQVVTRLLDRLKKPGPLIVSGASGVGKSSLLRAGVLPALRREGSPLRGAESWPTIVFTPGMRPLDELAVCTASIAGTDPALVQDLLRTHPEDFALVAHQAAMVSSERTSGDLEATSQTQPRLLMIVDQFEQVFTEASDEKERRAFITALDAAATTKTGPAQVPAALVVLVVRADFFSHCIAYPELASAAQDLYRVPPMSAEQLREAISWPARVAGSAVEPGLIEVLLSDLAGRSDAGALPLLSYTLAQTWTGRTSKDLTIADYARVGAVEGTIATTAERVYAELTVSQQAMARRLFMRLIVVSEHGGNMARPISRAQLGGMPADEAEDLDTVIERFTRARLIILTDHNIAISHDALLTAWPRLSAWLAESWADLIVQARLSADSAEWARSGRDPAYLYTGSRLAHARAAAVRMDAIQSEQDFLHASVRKHNKSGRRRQAVLVLFLILLIVLAAETFVLLLR